MIFFLLLAAFLTIMLCGYRMLMRSLPPAKGRFPIPGLESEVRVYRDGYSIPHIFAKNERDLFLAQGFVTAQDRLWQMDFLRHSAQGKLSELFGKKASDTDSLMRLAGIRAAAENAALNLSEASRRLLERYAQGVNAYLQQNKNRLPLEFVLANHIPEPWKPEDSIALFRRMVWQSDVHWLSEPFFTELRQKIAVNTIQEILPWNRAEDVHSTFKSNDASEINRFLRSVLREKLLPPPVSGSMSWAVSPKRSITGKPLFSIITRNAMTSPAPWYEIRLASGAYEVSGFSLPGFPMVILGHNAAIAWGWTDFRNDVAYGMKRAFGDETSAIYKINMAKNWNSFQSALPNFVSLEKYFVYADTSGNIGFQEPNPHPAGAGTGKPYAFNPEDGCVGAGIEFSENPHCTLPFQSERVQVILSQKNKLSLEDLKQIQSDAVSDFALRFLQKIKPLMPKDTLLNPFEQKLLESLHRWDGAMKPGSCEAVCFETFIQQCMENIYRDEMGDSLFASLKNLSCLHPEFLLRTVRNPRSAWFDDVRTRDRVETAAEILSKSYREAVSRLSQKWGNDLSKWSWAGLHTVSFHHPFGEQPLYGKMFALGPFAVGGCATAVLSVDGDADKLFRATAGPSARMLMDVSNWDHAVSVLPPGQSGQPMDAHYQDQVQFYLQNFYHPELWDSTKIAGSGWDLTTLESEAARARR